MTAFLRFLGILAAGGGFFLGSLFTMWISDLLVSPFGLHGYTYGRAMALDLVVLLSLLTAGVVYGIVSSLLD